MKGNFLVVLFFLIVRFGFCQEGAVVHGIISGPDGPLPGATIRMEGTDTGVAADPEGAFSLEIKETGVVNLEIRSTGYVPLKKKFILLPGEKRELNVVLEEHSLGLEEVVVTGNMKPTFIKDSPVKVEVISSRYLNTFMPAAASSVVDAVKLLNGVQEVVACGVCFTNSISINGLPGPYTAVLMDGTPMYGNLASVYGLNGVPNMIIDRLEVIKGPASTLYGSEAMAGVINIITKDPAKQPLLSVDVMGTSLGEMFGNVAMAPKIGKSAGFFGLNYGILNNFEDRNRDGFSDLVNMDRYSFFSKWDIYRESGRKFSVMAKYYYEDRRNGVEEYLRDRNYRKLRGSNALYGESIYTKRAELFGTYEFKGAENLKIDFSMSRHLQDSYYGEDHYKAEQNIGFANLIWDKTLQEHSLLLGITSRLQYYDDNTVATQSRTPDGGEVNKADNQFIPGIFVQDEWKISDQLTLMGGMRLDNYEAHGPIFSPRFNFKVKPGKWTNVRGNFGTGFRIVNLFTEDHAFVSGQRAVEIVEELKPERSYNGALNINHVYTAGNSQGTIDIDAYYTFFTNKIIPDYADPAKIVYANTSGNAISKGIGLNFVQEFAFPLSINLGMNVQRTSRTEENENGEMETSAVEFAPEWSGVLTASYNFKKADFTIAYSGRLTGTMALPEVYDLDASGEPLADPRPLVSLPFSIHNLQLAKKISADWSLYGGVQNIFDFIQPFTPLTGYNDPAAPAGFSKFFDTAYAYAPIHGREIYLGVKWDLQGKR